MKAVHVIFAILLLIVALDVHADDLRVIDVRRNIPMSDDEAVYKDYYLSAGDVSGLKKNLVVTATRKITIRDANGSQTYGEIDVPVGQLRVLAVFGKVAVAREYKLLSRDENPMLEQTGLMVGDGIELKGSFTDNKPLVAPKRHVSEADAPTAFPPASEERNTASVAPTTPVVTPSAAPPAATPAATTIAEPTSARSAAAPAVAANPTE